MSAIPIYSELTLKPGTFSEDVLTQVRAAVETVRNTPIVLPIEIDTSGLTAQITQAVTAGIAGGAGGAFGSAGALAGVGAEMAIGASFQSPGGRMGRYPYEEMSGGLGVLGAGAAAIGAERESDIRLEQQAMLAASPAVDHGIRAASPYATLGQYEGGLGPAAMYPQSQFGSYGVTPETLRMANIGSGLAAAVVPTAEERAWQQSMRQVRTPNQISSAYGEPSNQEVATGLKSEATDLELATLNGGIGTAVTMGGSSPAAEEGASGRGALGGLAGRMLLFHSIYRGAEMVGDYTSAMEGYERAGNDTDNEDFLRDRLQSDRSKQGALSGAAWGTLGLSWLASKISSDDPYAQADNDVANDEKELRENQAADRELRQRHIQEANIKAENERKDAVLADEQAQAESISHRLMLAGLDPSARRKQVIEDEYNKASTDAAKAYQSGHQDQASAEAYNKVMNGLVKVREAALIESNKEDTVQDIYNTSRLKTIETHGQADELRGQGNEVGADRLEFINAQRVTLDSIRARMEAEGHTAELAKEEETVKKAQVQELKEWDRTHPDQRAADRVAAQAEATKLAEARADSRDESLTRIHAQIGVNEAMASGNGRMADLLRLEEHIRQERKEAADSGDPTMVLATRALAMSELDSFTHSGGEAFMGTASGYAERIQAHILSGSSSATSAATQARNQIAAEGPNAPAAAAALKEAASDLKKWIQGLPAGVALGVIRGGH